MRKLIETVFLTAITASVLFFTPKILQKSCQSLDESNIDAEHVRY